MICSIVEEYVDAAKKHGVASKCGDHKAANKAYKSLIVALNKIRTEPDKGAASLRGLLTNSDSFVICSAATHLLPLQEMIAKMALKSLVDNETELVAFNAQMVLREWEAGRLKVE